jgi:hypothetical protein
VLPAGTIPLSIRDWAASRIDTEPSTERIRPSGTGQRFGVAATASPPAVI